MKTFGDFELTVRKIAHNIDFAENKHKLKDVKCFQYETFIYIMKYGANITNAMTICVKIFNISVDTELTENDILYLIPQFSLISRLIDNK